MIIFLIEVLLLYNVSGVQQSDSYIYIYIYIYIHTHTHIYIYFMCTCDHLGPTLCDPMDCSPPGSSVHEIFPASPVSPALAGSFFSTEPPGKLYFSKFFTIIG